MVIKTKEGELVVWRPFVAADGCLIPLVAALLNARKKTYWVEYSDGDCDFVPEEFVVWQREVVWPKT